MKQQNKLMPCPSVALGLFIGLILYDHRRAIAWSKLISSKRQWVKGGEKKRKRKKNHSDGSSLPERGDQQMTNTDRAFGPNTCLTATAFAQQCLTCGGKELGKNENANKTIMPSPCLQNREGLHLWEGWDV